MLRLKPPKMISTLAGDAMYFYAARNALANGVECTRAIDLANADLASLQQNIDRLSRTPEGGVDDRLISRNSTKLEPLFIQMEGAEYRLGAAYGPMLQGLSIAHILCVASAEAHINIQAHTRLGGRELKLFERLALDTKWLFLPKLLG